jgi:hypothetical protein
MNRSQGLIRSVDCQKYIQFFSHVIPPLWKQLLAAGCLKNHEPSAATLWFHKGKGKFYTNHYG